MEGRGSPDDRGIDYRHVYLDPFLIISEYSLIKIDMIILRNNERLMAEIDRIAEVAGYLWTKGWAERNGGNISVNLTTLLSEEEKALPALVSSIPLQEAMTALCGHVFYVTGTGKRMRYVAKDHPHVMEYDPGMSDYRAERGRYRSLRDTGHFGVGARYDPSVGGARRGVLGEARYPCRR